MRASRHFECTYYFRLTLNDEGPLAFLPILPMALWQGVLGKEHADERVEGKAEAPNEREKEDGGKPDLRSVFDFVDPPRVRIWRCR